MGSFKNGNLFNREQPPSNFRPNISCAISTYGVISTPPLSVLVGLNGATMAHYRAIRIIDHCRLRYTMSTNALISRTPISACGTVEDPPIRSTSHSTSYSESQYYMGTLRISIPSFYKQKTRLIPIEKGGGGICLGGIDILINKRSAVKRSKLRRPPGHR